MGLTVWETKMFTLLEVLHGLLMHITEDHAKEMPEPLEKMLDTLCVELGKWLDDQTGK